jgi:hypothetical protein
MAKNYESIVKPLKKIEKNLTDYAKSQEVVAMNLEDQKSVIDINIAASKQEGKMAKFTAGKIGALLGADGFEEDFQDTPTQEKAD